MLQIKKISLSILLFLECAKGIANVKLYMRKIKIKYFDLIIIF